MKRRILTVLALALTLQPLLTPTANRMPTETSPFNQSRAYIAPLKSLAQPDLQMATEAVYVAPKPAPVVTTQATPVNTTSAGCGDNSYANFIYMHESGCRTNAINPIGACGIGQAWPCSKMGCSLSDYDCQNAYFTAYANNTYGGWASAYAFWVAHSWW